VTLKEAIEDLRKMSSGLASGTKEIRDAKWLVHRLEEEFTSVGFEKVRRILASLEGGLDQTPFVVREDRQIDQCIEHINRAISLLEEL
jgi:hypothetical protein